MTSRDTVRSAFAAAAEGFVSMARGVSREQWEGPGLGEWSVRSLVGHTSRSLLTVEAYLDAGAERVDIPGPTEYFMAILGALSNEAAVAERGRQAGIALGEDPAQEVRVIAARVLPKVEGTPDDALVGTPWGGMRLIDYLPTRIFELVIHTRDLAAALDRQGSVPEPASEVTWELIRSLARRSDREHLLLRALTGRLDLPDHFSILKA